MRVYVEEHDFLTEKMFKEHGHKCVNKAESAQVIVFVGGADVNPALYGEDPHPFTNYSVERDLRSIHLHNTAASLNLPMVGICRGAQFLTVMQGGKLIQHIENHAIKGTHWIVPVGGFITEEFEVSSTHHQAMIPKNKEEIIAYSKDGIVEITQSLDLKYTCVQGHPEHMKKGHKFREWFIEEIEETVNWMEKR